MWKEVPGFSPEFDLSRVSPSQSPLAVGEEPLCPPRWGQQPQARPDPPGRAVTSCPHPSSGLDDVWCCALNPRSSPAGPPWHPISPGVPTSQARAQGYHRGGNKTKGHSVGRGQPQSILVAMGLQSSGPPPHPKPQKARCWGSWQQLQLLPYQQGPRLGLFFPQEAFWGRQNKPPGPTC